MTKPSNSLSGRVLAPASQPDNEFDDSETQVYRRLDVSETQLNPLEVLLNSSNVSMGRRSAVALPNYSPPTPVIAAVDTPSPRISSTVATPSHHTSTILATPSPRAVAATPSPRYAAAVAMPFMPPGSTTTKDGMHGRMPTKEEKKAVLAAYNVASRDPTVGTNQNKTEFEEKLACEFQQYYYKFNAEEGVSNPRLQNRSVSAIRKIYTTCKNFTLEYHEKYEALALRTGISEADRKSMATDMMKEAQKKRYGQGAPRSRSPKFTKDDEEVYFWAKHNDLLGMYLQASDIANERPVATTRPAGRDASNKSLKTSARDEHLEKMAKSIDDLKHMLAEEQSDHAKRVKELNNLYKGVERLERMLLRHGITDEAKVCMNATLRGYYAKISKLNSEQCDDGEEYD